MDLAKAGEDEVLKQLAAEALLRKLVACHCGDGGEFRGCGEGVQAVTTCARSGKPPGRG